MDTSLLLSLFQEDRAVSTDTRALPPGAIFFALRGPNFNGNAYAAQALAQGAGAVVIDDPAFQQPGDPRYILTDNALHALQSLATAYRNTLNIPLIGLTGSNGKTTSKELIAAALSAERRVAATAGNLNNHIGVPLTLLRIPPDAAVAVVEMGANQPGDIAELADIARPTHVMITNIGKAHLEGLGGLDGVQHEKAALFRFVRQHGGTAFVNLNDPRVAAEAAGLPDVVTFGAEGADYEGRILQESFDEMQIEVRSRFWPDVLLLHTRMGGHYNLLNVLGAVAIADRLGVSREGIAAGIFSYQPRNNRSQLEQLGEMSLWLDAYNANPSSMRASIENALHLAPRGTALVLGDMFELGESAEAEHRALGDFIESLKPDLVIGIGALMQHALAQLSTPKAWFPDTAAAAAAAPVLLENARLVLFKGSRGMALERVTDALRKHKTQQA